MTTPIDQENGTQKLHGFAALDAETRRQIASKGGKAAHAQHRAHVFTSEEAKAAGRKGGAVVSRDRKHMAEIGRIGGLRRRRAREAELAAQQQQQQQEAAAAVAAPQPEIAEATP